MKTILSVQAPQLMTLNVQVSNTFVLNLAFLYQPTILFIIIKYYISDLCNQNFFCAFWQSSHRSFTDDESVGTRVFNCTLLSSCEHQYVGNASFPTIINSGTRFCLPDPFKRRPCMPGCPASRKFCHGRCVYGGTACFFSPCSPSPYREDAGSTCSQLAMDQAEKGNCTVQCCDLSSDSEISSCQSCLENNIPDTCAGVSGSPCWYCGVSILQKWKQCTETFNSTVETINCIQQQQTPGCSECICTLLCYWSPEGELCKSCRVEPELATLFLHHQHCPQGWVYSSSSSKCYRAFSNSKPWKYAARYCQSGGGNLAEPKNEAGIYGVLEAINSLAASGVYWLGGAKKSLEGNCVEMKDEFLCGSSNVVASYYDTRENCASHCHGNPDCVAWTFTTDSENPILPDSVQNSVNLQQSNPQNCWLMNSTSCKGNYANWVWGTPQCGGSGDLCIEKPGQYLWCGNSNDFVGETTYQDNKEECAQHCFANPDCGAWFYRKVKTQLNCFLMNTTSCTNSFHSDQLYDYGTRHCGEQKTSEEFVWAEDNSLVDNSNWDYGYPVSG